MESRAGKEKGGPSGLGRGGWIGLGVVVAELASRREAGKGVEGRGREGGGGIVNY